MKSEPEEDSIDNKWIREVYEKNQRNHALYYFDLLNNKTLTIQALKSEINNVKSAIKWGQKHEQLAALRAFVAISKFLKEFLSWKEYGDLVEEAKQSAASLLRGTDEDEVVSLAVSVAIDHVGYLLSIGNQKEAKNRLNSYLEATANVDGEILLSARPVFQLMLAQIESNNPKQLKDLDTILTDVARKLTQKVGEKQTGTTKIVESDALTYLDVMKNDMWESMKWVEMQNSLDQENPDRAIEMIGIILETWKSKETVDTIELVGLMVALSRYAEQKHFLDSAMEILRDALSYLQENPNPSLKFGVLSAASSLAFQMDDYGLSINYANEVIAYYKEIGDKKLTSHGLLRLAISKEFIGEDPEPEVTEALALAREIADLEGVVVLQNYLGEIMLKKGQVAEGIQLIEAAIKVAIHSGNRRIAPGGLTTLADHYRSVRDYNFAIKLYKEANQIIEEEDGNFHNRLTLSDIGYTFLEAGEGINARYWLFEAGRKYYEVREYETSQKHFNDLVNAMDGEVDKFYLPKSLYYLGLMRYGFEDNEESVKFFRRSADIFLDFDETPHALESIKWSIWVFQKLKMLGLRREYESKASLLLKKLSGDDQQKWIDSFKTFGIDFSWVGLLRKRVG